MKLTGKGEVLFGKWWYKQRMNGEVVMQLTAFDNLNPSMQYGVYVDFADSVRVYVDVEHNEINRKFHFNISTKPMSHDIGSKSIYDTRPEARVAAIEKLNEILNERL